MKIAHAHKNQPQAPHPLLAVSVVTVCAVYVVWMGCARAVCSY
jgi:hypothetical protein